MRRSKVSVGSRNCQYKTQLNLGNKVSVPECVGVGTASPQMASRVLDRTFLSTTQVTPSWLSSTNRVREVGKCVKEQLAIPEVWPHLSALMFQAIYAKLFQLGLQKGKRSRLVIWGQSDFSFIVTYGAESRANTKHLSQHPAVITPPRQHHLSFFLVTHFSNCTFLQIFHR